MGFSHFRYKMDRKNPIVQKFRATYRQQMPGFLIPGERKKIEQRQQKDSKTETLSTLSVDRGLPKHQNEQNLNAATEQSQG